MGTRRDGGGWLGPSSKRLCGAAPAPRPGVELRGSAEGRYSGRCVPQAGPRRHVGELRPRVGENSARSPRPGGGPKSVGSRTLRRGPCRVPAIGTEPTSPLWRPRPHRLGARRPKASLECRAIGSEALPKTKGLGRTTIRLSLTDGGSSGRDGTWGAGRESLGWSGRGRGGGHGDCILSGQLRRHEGEPPNLPTKSHPTEIVSDLNLNRSQPNPL